MENKLKNWGPVDLMPLLCKKKYINIECHFFFLKKENKKRELKKIKRKDEKIENFDLEVLLFFFWTGILEGFSEDVIDTWVTMESWLVIVESSRVIFEDYKKIT